MFQDVVCEEGYEEEDDETSRLEVGVLTSQLAGSVADGTAHDHSGDDEQGDLEEH